MGLASRLAGAVLLLGALACGGGGGGSTAPPSSPAVAAATALAYTDPADTTRWRLGRNAASTPTHLVLDLLPPSGTSGMGVTLVLTVDGTRAAWGNVEGTSPAKAGGVYGGTLAQRASIQGSTLRLLLSQENPTAPVAYGTAPVLSVALDLRTGAGVGDAALVCSQGGHLGAGLGTPVAITPLTGSLRAQ